MGVVISQTTVLPMAFGIRVEKDELTKFVQNLDTAAKKFGMDVNADKSKIMTNNCTLQRDRGRSWKQ